MLVLCEASALGQMLVEHVVCVVVVDRLLVMEMEVDRLVAVEMELEVKLGRW